MVEPSSGPLGDAPGDDGGRIRDRSARLAARLRRTGTGGGLGACAAPSRLVVLSAPAGTAADVATDAWVCPAAGAWDVSSDDHASGAVAPGARGGGSGRRGTPGEDVATGAWDGAATGAWDAAAWNGPATGAGDGAATGAWDGPATGAWDGPATGAWDGAATGAWDGAATGAWSFGAADGSASDDGCADGASDGSGDGPATGAWGGPATGAWNGPATEDRDGPGDGGDGAEAATAAFSGSARVGGSALLAPPGSASVADLLAAPRRPLRFHVAPFGTPPFGNPPGATPPAEAHPEHRAVRARPVWGPPQRAV